MRGKGLQLDGVKWITGSERTRECEGFGQFRDDCFYNLVELDNDQAKPLFTPVCSYATAKYRSILLRQR